MTSSNDMCREGDNLLNGVLAPVVFVPGVMGSRLELTVDYLPNWHWDPERTDIMAQWLALSAGLKRSLLDMTRECQVRTVNESRTPAITPSQRQRGWAGVSGDSYGAFLVDLEARTFGSNRTPVYAYGYDWRQDIRRLGAQLAADLLGQSVTIPGGLGTASPTSRFGSSGLLAHAGNADRCILLTHSMGGLVARAALKASTALQSKVLAVLHVVQPATGAPVLYRRFVTGAISEHDGGWPFTRILGQSGPDFATVVSACAGPNQLMPSNIYRDACAAANSAWVSHSRFRENHATPHRSTVSVYSVLRQPPTAAPPGIMRADVSASVQADLARRINEVESFHQWLGDWKLEPKTWAVYGDGMPTDTTEFYDLPPEDASPPDNIRMEVLPSYGDSMPVILYYGVRPDGTRAYLDEVADIQNRGWNAQKSRHAGAAPAPLSGHSYTGDTTVPAFSGRALFSPGQTAEITARPINWASTRQFRAPDVEHEPAFREGRVQALVSDFIQYALTLSP